jgi:hypothetical protein
MVGMNKVGMELPSNLATLRDVKASILGEKLKEDYFTVKSEGTLSSRVARTIRELIPSPMIQIRFILKKDYEDIIDAANVGENKKTQPSPADLRRHVAGVKFSGRYFKNLAFLLLGIDCKPPAEEGISLADNVSGVEGVIYIPKTSKDDFLYLNLVDQLDLESGDFEPDVCKLYLGKWKNRFVRNLSRLPWMKSLLVLPIVNKGNEFLGAVVVSAGREFVEPAVDLPWLKVLGNEIYDSLFEIVMDRRYPS